MTTSREGNAVDDRPEPEPQSGAAGNGPQTGDTPAGPGSTIGERITGVRDPQDPDGLLTLDDLPDPTGDASDLSALIRKAQQYGDDSAG